jgi:hypothetical protein
MTDVKPKYSTTGFTKVIPVDEKDKEVIPKKYRFVKTIDILALDFDQAKEKLSEMTHTEHYEDLTEDFAFPLKKTLRFSKEDHEVYDEYDQGYECDRCGKMEFGTISLSTHVKKYDNEKREWFGECKVKKEDQ